MSEFETLFQDWAIPALDEVLGETIRYRSFASGEPAPWKSITARVKEGNVEDMDVVGVVGLRIRRPINVAIAKSALVKVVPKNDEIEWKGTVYGVRAVSREQLGQWVLYCVA